jgi:hypothetical protein
MIFTRWRGPAQGFDGASIIGRIGVVTSTLNA